MKPVLKEIFDAIQSGEHTVVPVKVKAALDAGIPAGEILADGMIAAMAEVGRLFEEGEFFVPEMLISARSMQGAMSLLRPLLVKQGVQPAGRAILATVHGDLHNIGKNLVSLMLEGAGFEVHDLGVDMGAETIVRAVAEEAPDILALSAMLTTTMKGMKLVIDALEAAGLRAKVKVIVGGAPLTEEFAR